MLTGQCFLRNTAWSKHEDISKINIKMTWKMIVVISVQHGEDGTTFEKLTWNT